MIPTTVWRAIQQKPSFNIYTNPYKAKRLWPPDFSKLPPKHQFRLERRYKRRLQLKWARPRWNKAIKLAQLTSIVGIVVYVVLFMDIERENPPFQGIRSRFDNLRRSIWTRPSEGIQRGEELDDVLPPPGTK